MSPPTSVASMEQRLLPIEFLIIGGGVAGLCSAITLTTAGHDVTLFEQNSSFDETAGAAGCRIPPNMSKFLVRWGMEEQLKKLSTTSRTIQFARYESGYMLGKHSWDEAVLKETGGDFVCMHYGALRKLLYESALEHGATVHSNSHVQSTTVTIDNRPKLTLTSGETFEADVIIGADGLSSLARKTILGQEERDTSLGLAMYNAVIPGDLMALDQELGELLETSTSFTWLGSERAAIGFPIRRKGGNDQENDYTLNVWIPHNDDPEDGWTHFIDSLTLQKDLNGCDPRLQKLAGLASSVTCVPVTERAELEDWVHDDGHLLVIGDAAHAYYPGSLQAISIAVGDAAALGHLFQHLHHEEQIEGFLWAFQEIRQGRVKTVREAEMSYLSTLTMPNGEAQETRDEKMRQRYDGGLNALDLEEGDVAQQWEMIRVTFGYDAEEEADDWWMKWGKLRERAEFEADTPVNELMIEIKEEESNCEA